MLSFWGPLLPGLILCGQALASTVHVESALRAVPVTLAGTLEPASLSVNGRPLPGEGGKAKALLLNGGPVEATESAIFLRTSLDHLELVWDMEEGGRRPLAALSYPAIVSFEISPARATIEVNKQTRAVLLDGKELPLETGRAELQHSSEQGWLERPHVVELQSSEGGSRIYNLEPTFREDVLSDRRVALGSISSPDGNGFGLAGWIQKAWPSGKALSLGLGFTRGSSIDEAHTTQGMTLQSIIVYVRAGLRPFHPGDGWFDARRVEVGLFGEGFVSLRSTFGFSTPPPPDTAQTHAALGFYIHLEPIRLDHWGLAVYLSPLPIRVLRPFDYANVGNGVELGYHW